MIDLVGAIQEFVGLCTPERRIELLMMFYYTSRGNIHIMLSALENEQPDSDVYKVARDNLQALHGILTERLQQYGEPPNSEG